MTEIFFFVLLYHCFFLKIFVNLPRHERDEVLTRSCGCLVTFVLRSHQLRVEVFLWKSLERKSETIKQIRLWLLNLTCLRIR